MANIEAATVSSISERAERAIRSRLSGQPMGRLRTAMLFAGPAVVASIAYMDPGNFATNIQSGAAYGYSLLWVVLGANLVAMMFQALSAKLGVVTGRNLAEHCRDQFRPGVALSMWGVAELAAMATDLAEFIGGAVGFSLLFHTPLMVGMAVVALITLGILTVQGRGFRPLELAIGGFVGVIGVSYLIEMFIAPVDWSAAAAGLTTPKLPDAQALTLAVGIIGATVMPHALYLHSALTQYRPTPRDDREREMMLRYSNREVLIALAAAGLVNMAMVAMAAAAFHAGHPDVAEIETAYHTLTPLLGAGAAGLFLLSLLASGVSSSVVGTLAGQVIMQGLTKRTIPIWVRRLITIAPSFVVVAAGVNATQALVVSQVVLSLTLPVPMIALVMLTSRRDLMGRFANGPVLKTAAIAATVLIAVLNLFLVLQTLGVPLPGLS